MPLPIESREVLFKISQDGSQEKQQTEQNFIYPADMGVLPFAILGLAVNAKEIWVKNGSAVQFPVPSGLLESENLDIKMDYAIGVAQHAIQPGVEHVEVIYSAPSSYQD